MNIRIVELLNKPYYLFRPSQALLRLRRHLTHYRSVSALEETVLPWGLPIRYHPTDMIGAAIFRAGLYDLCVSEVLWRLLEPGETAVDVGANIGHMTSLMSARVGAGGHVFSFEPHPQIFQELAANAGLWKAGEEGATVHLIEAALSSAPGQGNLFVTAEFAENRGTAALGPSVTGDEGTVAYSVLLQRLDDSLEPQNEIGVLKLDVEGHEMEVLRGAAHLLNGRHIRDIVFEEHKLYPSPVTDYLEALGYSLYQIQQGAVRVKVSPAACTDTRFAYDAPSYLATLDALRARRKLGGVGYRVLRLSQPNDRQGRLAQRLLTVGLALAGILYLVRHRSVKK